MFTPFECSESDLQVGLLAYHSITCGTYTSISTLVRFAIFSDIEGSDSSLPIQIVSTEKEIPIPFDVGYILFEYNEFCGTSSTCIYY